MGLNETTKNMRELLAALSIDLEKAVGGNKAASQRVRTGTIRLEKTAKLYRKESISAERKGGPKKAAKAKSKPPVKKAKAASQMKRATAKLPSKRK